MYFRLLCRKLYSSNISFKRPKYYVLLPQIPPDTPETNPLLRTDHLPPFSKVSHRQCINAIGKLVLEYESGIHVLDTKLSDPTLPKTVQNVVLPLDHLTVPLHNVWATLKIMYGLHPDQIMHDTYMNIYTKILRAKQQLYISPSIYNAFKELQSNEQTLAEPAVRVVRKHLLESRLSGMDLPSNKLENLKDCLRKIQTHSENFRKHVDECTSRFSHTLELSDALKLPQDLLSDLAEDESYPERGPWKVTLEPNIYSRFMQHCDTRLLRWNIWHAKNIVASSTSGVVKNNSICIEEIRYNRMEQANILGYDTFAEMSMETKMAGSLENIMAMITTLHVKSKTSTDEEIEELQNFAEQNGFEHKLELWDLPFWQRKHKEALFSLDDSAVRQYFPLTTVLRGIFDFCHLLFNITIVEATEKVDKWHEDVIYYRILNENGVQIASFFLDAYSRPSDKLPGCWMEIGKNRSDVVGSEPLSYLIFNFPPPQEGKPSIISFKELELLLKKFGHVLQHSLTTVPYNDVAGISNLEWDAVNICPLVMSSWLKDHQTTALFSGHCETGEKLPAELHSRLVNAQNYMSSWKLTEQLYCAALDLELYSSKEFWKDISKRLWSEYLPFSMDKKQAHVCSFSPIFCDEYPAAYFTNIWSEMIAADVFRAFEEVGLNDVGAIQKVAQRFKETYLTLGGGCHSSEVFRQFRGRDPSTDALVQKCGLDPTVVKHAVAAQ